MEYYNNASPGYWCQQQFFQLISLHFICPQFVANVLRRRGKRSGYGTWIYLQILSEIKVPAVHIPPETKSDD